MAITNLAVFLSFLAPAVLASPVAPNPNSPNLLERQAKAPPGLGPRPGQSVDAGSPAGLASERACTYTTKLTPTAPPCRWDGTVTIWPTTAYATTKVDCRGCGDVAVVEDLYPCPNKPVETYTIMQEPTTCWSTVCAPSSSVFAEVEARGMPAPTEAPRIQVNAELRQRDGAAPATTACPTTLVLQPPKTAGKTFTEYAQTTTKTVAVECGGCSLVVSTALAGYGPIARFTTTVTAPVAVATAYQCK